MAGQRRPTAELTIAFGAQLWSQASDWPRFRDAALEAETAGWDSLWTWDHLMAIQGPWRQPIFEGWASLAAWAALTLLGSTVTGSAAAAAGIGFAALLVLSIAAAIPNLGQFLPGGLAEPALALAVGAPVDPGEVLIPVVATSVLIAIALGASVWSFSRQEL